MTNHFNEMTEAEQERLVVLIEECSEVIKAGTKALRHGYESTNPKKRDGETNRRAIARELGDLLNAMDRMTDALDIDGEYIALHRIEHTAQVEQYLHHQRSGVAALERKS